MHPLRYVYIRDEIFEVFLSSGILRGSTCEISQEIRIELPLSRMSLLVNEYFRKRTPSDRTFISKADGVNSLIET